MSGLLMNNFEVSESAERTKKICFCVKELNCTVQTAQYKPSITKKKKKDILSPDIDSGMLSTVY